MLSGLKHKIKWDTKIGWLYRSIITYFGLKFLTLGRRLLKRSLGRCSWCGANCGFDSTISKKGMRCDSPNKKCTDKPDV